MAAPTRSRALHVETSARPRGLVIAIVMPPTIAVTRRTVSSERIVGPTSRPTIATVAVVRVGVMRARARSQSASVDQKYAAGSGMSSPTYATDGIAAVAIPHAIAARRGTNRRASAYAGKREAVMTTAFRYLIAA